jgi:hypothetical protein
MRETFHSYLVAAMPRIFSLLDKNPYSPTFGSFDRKYWQYKILDFPSGMQQELVLPLAYVWTTGFEGNRYHQLPRIREYLVGVFDYHVKCSHPDGSLDDYFPHERAFGATAYALTALTEAALLTGLCSVPALLSLEKSGEFLAGYREAGKLSNHLAIASAALINLHALTGKELWKAESNRLISELAEKQHEEGWFPEYEGCDIGYQTVTFEFLARRHSCCPDERIMGMLRRNLDFLMDFAHPDGSLGGEYCSRNTYNYYPGGFALLSETVPKAAAMLGFFLKGVQTGACNHLEDDGVFGHLLSSYVTVLNTPQLRVSQPTFSAHPSPFVRDFPGSGLFTAGTGELSVFGSLTKGGVFKVFKRDALVWSDTGFSGRLSDGTLFCQNKPCTSSGLINGLEITIEGDLQKYSSKRLSRFQMIVLRVLSLFFGRFRVYSNGIRFSMQKLLIYNRKKLPLRFLRRISLGRDFVSVRDELTVTDDAKVVSLHRGTDCVNMHVVTSDSFQSANLLPWERIEVESDIEIVSLKKIG